MCVCNTYNTNLCSVKITFSSPDVIIITVFKFNYVAALITGLVNALIYRLKCIHEIIGN
jgi:hypothetical protein